MVAMEEIEAIIGDVVRGRLKGVKIVSVHVDRDTDSGGDEMLNVTIVFESQNDVLDASKISSMVRYVRPKLDEIGEPSFPLISFISKEDAEQFGIEAS